MSFGPRRTGLETCLGDVARTRRHKASTSAVGCGCCPGVWGLCTPVPKPKACQHPTPKAPRTPPRRDPRAPRLHRPAVCAALPKSCNPRKACCGIRVSVSAGFAVHPSFEMSAIPRVSLANDQHKQHTRPVHAALWDMVETCVSQCVSCTCCLCKRYL